MKKPHIIQTTNESSIQKRKKLATEKKIKYENQICPGQKEKNVEKSLVINILFYKHYVNKLRG